MNKKIAIVAVNGKAGKKIAEEAVNHGFDVTGFGRHTNDTAAQHYVKKDLFDLTKEDLAGFDAVVDAFGAFTPETLPLHTTSLMHLADLVAGTDTRLLVVGGAGSLYVDKDHTTHLSETPDFPDDFKPLATAMGEALDKLRERNDVNWTYLSPAADFQADSAKTGKYILGGEELTLNPAGESVISYADYAVAMVDEIEKGTHNKERISVVKA